jgi:hypothetical protein
MADLGELIGSLMVGVIRARRMADEETAALAEYYKTNPLLEQLSVPRVRIPDLTIDMPFLVEDSLGGEAGNIGSPEKIAAASSDKLKAVIASSGIKVNPAFHEKFSLEVIKQLKAAQASGAPPAKESVTRSVLSAFTGALTESKSELSSAQKETLSNALTEKASEVAIAKAAVAPSILANIKTAEVKEKSSSANVVRLKITLKEEGLEWSVRTDDSGNRVNTLQPE